MSPGKLKHVQGMTPNSDALATIGRTLDQLRDPTLPCVDLDAFAAAIESVRTQTGGDESLRVELALLRDDYLARIIGMVKAIAVADQKRHRYGEALEFIGKLTTMTASQLIDQYRTISARFRDTFPSNMQSAIAGRAQRRTSFAATHQS